MTKSEAKVLVQKTVKNKSEFNKLAKLPKNIKNDFQLEMEKYARNFLKLHFDMQLGIPIVIDGRLTRAGGSYHYNGKNGLRIKMSERFVACALMDEEEGLEAILDVLGHELVHYAVHMQGKPFSDGNKEFEETLAKLNIGASGTTPTNKIKTKKKNTWYEVQDIYANKILKGLRYYNHAKKEIDWAGNRVGYRIVKTYF